MSRKYLAFDIETVKEWPDGGDWRAYRPLGIACAATLAADAETPELWHGVDDQGLPADRMGREDAARLVDRLSSAVGEGYTILTFNGLGFDLDILAEESGMLAECRELALAHVDMMFHVFCTLGYPVGLDAAAKAMGLPGKPPGMSGVLAPRMWAQGKRQKVLEYVAGDVRTTLALAAKCEQQARFRWITRRGRSKDMPLRSGWLTVRSAMQLPPPDTSWMSTPLPRGTFTAWLR